MNTAQNLQGWTRARFLAVFAALCVLQAGLIVLFAAREPKIAGKEKEAFQFRLLETPMTSAELSEKFFATDPTVFPLPGEHGFSERAWLRPAATEYDPPGEIAEPEWLTNNAADLGTNFPMFSRAKTLLPSLFDNPGSAQPEARPVFLAPEVVRTQSIFRLDNGLRARQLSRLAGLRAWPSAQLLRNSVVQIAVDSTGQVVVARLLERSDSAEADADALRKAQSLRFRPVPPGAPIWGKAIFEWQTAPVAPINGALAP